MAEIHRAALVCATTIAVFFCLCEPAFAESPDLSRLSLSAAENLRWAHGREVRIARMQVVGAEAAAASAGQRPNPLLPVGVASLGPQFGVGPAICGTR